MRAMGGQKSEVMDESWMSHMVASSRDEYLRTGGGGEGEACGMCSSYLS